MAKQQTPPAAPPYITDHTAQMLVKIGKEFFAVSKNADAYRQWHYDRYGCWPEDATPKKGRVSA